jgi:hypothetical protein
MTLRQMGYALNIAASDVLVAGAREVAGNIDAHSAIRVEIGSCKNMDFAADISLSQDKIAHLLKAIYVCKVLRRNFLLGFALWVIFIAAVLTLAAVNIVTPVYAGVASAAIYGALAANNRRIEKKCSNITFDKVLGTASKIRFRGK